MAGLDRRTKGRPEPVLVRPKDAAAMLAISERKLWQLTSCGSIPRVVLGTKLVR
jgi:predicted DNA-binding transcriptional regulator AlpA